MEAKFLLQVDHCEFPEDIFFDVENDVWFRPSPNGTGRTGITTVLLFLAGRITRAYTRPGISDIARGKSLGSVESVRYFGNVRSPVSGRISKLNEDLKKDPRPLIGSPYGEGWFAEYERFEESSLSYLLYGAKAIAALDARIKELKIRCFKVLPDEDLYSIGLECAAVLSNLGEELEGKPRGYVVHLVTDDPTADIEMVRWTMQTRNELVESRTEGNLFHFLVRKT